MSRARSLAALLISGALAVPLLGTAAPSMGSSPRILDGATVATAAAPSAAPRLRQRAKLTMYPQLAQPGKSTRSPGKAQSSMAAAFRPVRKGRPVVLQRRTGGRWVTAQTRRQGGRAIVEFNARYQHKGTIQKYRAVAKRYDGLSRKRTKGARTDRWDAPLLDDRFSDRSLPDGWAHRQTARTGYRKCAIASPKALRVGKGRLRLSVRKDPDRPSPERPKSKCGTKYGKFDWRITGMASTQGQRAFRYGFAAARIKFPRRAGQHGAFWLQPQDGSAPSGTEIDVIEWFGQRKNPDQQLSSFVHRDGTKDRTCGLIHDPGRFGSKWWRKYHVFSVDWTKKRYIFRIDGKETCRTKRFVSHTPQYLILSLQANTYEIPLLDGDPAAPHSSRRLPQHMHVDWVRYWER